MKKSGHAKENDMVGRKVIYEYEGDRDGEIVAIEGFVAAYDPELGMTIKALDSEQCPEWLQELKEGDGSINLCCFNLEHGDEPRRLMPLFVRRIVKEGAITREWANRVRRGRRESARQAACAFGG